MTEYIIGVLVTSWLLCFASLAVYGGKSDGATKAAFAVLLFYTVVIPLVPLVEEFEPEKLFLDIRLEDFELDGEYCAVAEEAFCDGVEDMLCEKYAIEKGEARVSLDSFDFEKIRRKKHSFGCCRY